MNPVATDTSPATTSPESQVYAPGTTVKIRDEEWLVESSSQDGDMVWLTVRGLRGIVQDTVAMFSPDLDVVEEVSPAETQIVADGLTARGVSASLISQEALGESKPAVATQDGVKEPLNRRTEVVITFQ